LAENAGIKSADTGNRMHFLMKKIEIKFFEFASKIKKFIRIYRLSGPVKTGGHA
jgi:hypothetical protein